MMTVIGFYKDEKKRTRPITTPKIMSPPKIPKYTKQYRTKTLNLIKKIEKYREDISKLADKIEDKRTNIKKIEIPYEMLDDLEEIAYEINHNSDLYNFVTGDIFSEATSNLDDAIWELESIQESAISENELEKSKKQIYDKLINTIEGFDRTVALLEHMDRVYRKVDRI